MSSPFILGEYRRTLDDRYRVAIPAEFVPAVAGDGAACILAKEQSGALSLWNAGDWQARLDRGVRLVEEKMLAGRLEGRVEEVQMLGRLLSTRHKKVSLAGRGRLSVPEGFREFLGAEPGSEVLVVGAGVCVELWRPDRWFSYIQQKMPGFRSLFDNLTS
jgi:MraZ protein